MTVGCNLEDTVISGLTHLWLSSGPVIVRKITFNINHKRFEEEL